MAIAFYIFSAVLIILNLLPLSHNQHWVFRVWDFGRIQLLVLEVLASLFGWIFLSHTGWYYYPFQMLLFLVIIHNAWLLIPYMPFYPGSQEKSPGKNEHTISILSANVYQFNTQYRRVIDTIRAANPDMVLTVESNRDWEQALRELESDYPHTHKETRENTYGMHFYSKIPIRKAQTHFFVTDDIPSFELDMQTETGELFTFFGVHPPPPSPSEEETSKERDGDLMAIARKVRKLDKPVVVVGDFNNVAWARSSRLFRKTSRLIDPRRGYGFVSTFHAKYKLLRVPIDLLFHSTDIHIREFKTLPKIGSDHLPMYCFFFIGVIDPEQEVEKESEEAGDPQKVEELISEGKKQDGDRDAVASG